MTEHKDQTFVHSVRRSYFKKAVMIIVTIFIPLVIIEAGYQIVYAYKAYEASRKKEDFYLYDPYLGWSGEPGGSGLVQGPNNTFNFKNNSLGFRDIEHDKSSDKPALVFLGASYPWGFEIPTEKMFVNLLRDRLKEYEIFNLSSVCYGTDQSLLVYKNWVNHYKGLIDRVILIASEAEIERNSTDIDHDCAKKKPKFEIVRDELVLTGIPVPQIDITQQQEPKPAQPESNMSLKTRIRKALTKSRFISALYHRYALFRNGPPPVEQFQPTEYDLRLTYKIFEELKRTVEAKKAELFVIIIPSYKEIEELPGYRPYQQDLIGMFEKLGIVYHDLTPIFKNTEQKTYYNEGEHWNFYGNSLGADAIYNFLTGGKGPKTQNNEINVIEANSPGR